MAANYFLNALEKISSLVKKYETETEKLKKDTPLLQEVINSTWRRETELKDLKAEHAAIDRKIQLSLKPVEQGDEKPYKNEVQEKNTGNYVDYRDFVPKEMRKIMLPRAVL